MTFQLADGKLVAPSAQPTASHAADDNLIAQPGHHANVESPAAAPAPHHPRPRRLNL
jgi:hypothetical protein